MGRLAAILFHANSGPRDRFAELVLYSAARTEDIEFFRNTSFIFGLELEAVVSAVFFARERLRGQTVTIYIDRNAALAALINGDSSSEAACLLIATFWFLAAAFDISIWLERVDTARNIADLPTRGCPLPFPVFEETAFPRLSEILKYYQEKIANNSFGLLNESMEETPPNTILFE